MGEFWEKLLLELLYEILSGREDGYIRHTYHVCNMEIETRAVGERETAFIWKEKGSMKKRRKLSGFFAVLFIFSLLLQLPMPKAVFADGSIIAHYEFEDNANDSSGNGKHGSVYGSVSYVDGIVGKALSLNGNGCIVMPNNLLWDHPNFTVIMRFKAAPGNSGGMLGYQNKAIGSSQDEYVPILSVRTDGILAAELWTDNSGIVVYSDNPVNDNDWHKVAISASTNSITVYLDDMQIGTKSGNVLPLGMVYNQIGGNYSIPRPAQANGWWSFSGLIDDVYVLDDGLDSEEIEELVISPPSASSISVNNNTGGIDDTVTVTGLSEGDVIKAYTSASGGEPVATASVSSGETVAVIQLGQLGTDAGSIFVSLTKQGKSESPRTEIAYSAEPGISVVTGQAPGDLVATILGGSMEVSNIQFTGTVTSAGAFNDGGTTIGFDNGIILSSGNARESVEGENDADDISYDNELDGDPDLDAILAVEGDGTSHDATVLEFDFLPESGYISFQYVLGSEEYTEYIQYGDVFGLFVNGVNAAVLPGTSTSISVRTINQETNSQYFIDNTDGHLATQMDGLSVAFTVSVPVNAGVTNHLKLAMADMDDSSYDTNIFIKAGSVRDQQLNPGKFRFGGRSGNTITLNRVDGSDGDVSVIWKAMDSEAEVIETDSVFFGEGETNKTFTVPEGTVSIALSGPTGGALIDNESVSVELDNIEEGQSIDQDITDALSNLDYGDMDFSEGDDENSVTDNFYLPLEGDNETAITWNISGDGGDFAAINHENGAVTVTRPESGQGDKNITLVATISKEGGEPKTKEFNIKIKELEQTADEAIAVAWNSLDYNDIEFAAGDDRNSITDSFIVPFAGENGTNVTWSVYEEDEDYLHINTVTGEVTITRPAYGEGDRNVRLEAVISKEGGADRDKSFEFVIKELEQTADEAIAAARNSLDYNNIEFAAGDDRNSITDSFFVPFAGENGTNVTWSVYEEDEDYLHINTVTGEVTVTRPAYGEGDRNVRLEAVISKEGGADRDKSFEFVIKELEQTADEAIAAARNSLDYNDMEFAADNDKDNVTEDFVLPFAGASGTTVIWSVYEDGDDYIAIDPGTGEVTVTRPGYEEEDVTVTLIATISKSGGEPQTKEFRITIKKQVMTDAQAVAADKASLNENDIIFSDGDSKNSVTQSFSVPLSGANGTTISWSESSPYARISQETGNVEITRPSYSTGDQTITLTATISKNGARDTKNISLIIKSLPDTGSNNDDRDNDPVNPNIPVQTRPAAGEVEGAVNGNKQQSLGNYQESKVGNQTQTTVLLDEKKLSEILEGVNPANVVNGNSTVTVSVPSKADIVVGELNGQMVKDMEAKEVVLEIRTENAGYTIPAKEIDISAVSEALGQDIKLSDISVKVEISKPAENMAKFVEDEINKGGYSVIVPPMNFKISCTYNGKTVDVRKFESYVSRVMAIPEGIDPNKITTGVIIDPDGTIRHVPTKVIVIDGKYYAEINSLTNSTYSVIWNYVEYEDVRRHWAGEAINDMGSRLVIEGTGDGMFDPDKAITRAEFASVIVKALGLKPEKSSGKFNDVRSTEWYSPYINTAAEYSIVSGYGKGKFGPYDIITREQAAAMIARAMDIAGLKLKMIGEEYEKLMTGFEDNSTVSDYARPYIASCIKAGILIGSDNRMIAPRDNITRAEAAVLIHRLLQKSELI
ncbi:MAG TPA: immunoglobulin-like domain-containing protein [Clostridia bacterium]|nr:immunoglobulin-like domain-containing protein [Clostridia bacterium]